MQEAVLTVFQKGLQYCDSKKLHLALLGIYERTDQHDMADELLKTLLRKFKSSAKVRDPIHFPCFLPQLCYSPLMGRDRTSGLNQQL